MAWINGGTTHGKHNHAPNFGRYVAGCERCDQLKTGEATPVRFTNTQPAPTYYRHNCATSKCGPICTAGEW